MGIFDIFRKKKDHHKTVIEIPEDRIDDVLQALEDVDSTDYLGQAADAGSKGSAAAKEGRYDDAWKYFHEQKDLYLKHANRSEFTPRQTIALDGSVHESLANILRLEGKHVDALIHFTYSLATSPKITKVQEKKVSAYLNRALLNEEGKNGYRDFLSAQSSKPSLRVINDQITQWKK